MRKNLPKLIGKSNELYLVNISIRHVCTNEVIHLLTSLEYLMMFNCTISRDSWNPLSAAIAASSVLKRLYITYNGNDLARGKSLARLLMQSKTLEEVYLANCNIECIVLLHY